MNAFPVQTEFNAQGLMDPPRRNIQCYKENRPYGPLSLDFGFL